METATRSETGNDPGVVDRVRHFVVRRPRDRVGLGLAGGIADRLGVGDVYVRAAFVSLTLAGAVGVALYLVGSAVAVPLEAPSRQKASVREMVALAVMFIGTLFFFRGLGLWFGDSIVWPGTLLAFGGAAIWDRTNLFDAPEGSGSAPTRTRIIVGALLLLAGLAGFSTSLDAIQGLGPALTAAALTAAGFTFIFGPWVASLGKDLARERRDRIRSEERSDMAAHLHDSVLQTLALIQRTDDPKRMITLARAQERDLRNYLYGSQDRDSTGGLREALQDAATTVEAAHDVPIDVVVVGDAPVSERMSALVAAAREAMNNAAHHSGATKVSVFAEVKAGSVEVFVTDQGRGFRRDEVASDRHGIADSILARVKRQGGEAEVSSEPGEGTEVRLLLPRGTHD
jgi:signal transduction histidine kinase